MASTLNTSLPPSPFRSNLFLLLMHRRYNLIGLQGLRILHFIASPARKITAVVACFFLSSRASPATLHRCHAVSLADVQAAGQVQPQLVWAGK